MRSPPGDDTRVSCLETQRPVPRAAAARRFAGLRPPCSRQAKKKQILPRVKCLQTSPKRVPGSFSSRSSRFCSFSPCSDAVLGPLGAGRGLLELSSLLPGARPAPRGRTRSSGTSPGLSGVLGEGIYTRHGNSARTVAAAPAAAINHNTLALAVKLPSEPGFTNALQPLLAIRHIST